MVFYEETKTHFCVSGVQLFAMTLESTGFPCGKGLTAELSEEFLSLFCYMINLVR